MIEDLKQVRDALASIAYRPLGGKTEDYLCSARIQTDAREALATLDRIIADHIPDASKMVVPICFRSLVKYAEWQMNEGADYHPTLPSCVAECKAMLSAAPTPAQPEKLDVEALKREVCETVTHNIQKVGAQYIVHVVSDIIEHLAAHYNITKKGE